MIIIYYYYYEFSVNSEKLEKYYCIRTTDSECKMTLPKATEPTI